MIKLLSCNYKVLNLNNEFSSTFCKKPVRSQCLLQNRRLSFLIKNPPKLIIRKNVISAPFTARFYQNTKSRTGNTTAVLYVTAIGIFMVGMSYAGVPLYRMFCQVSNKYFSTLRN